MLNDYAPKWAMKPIHRHSRTIDYLDADNDHVVVR